MPFRLQKIETMNEGFLPIRRRFFQDEFWEEKREFSKAEAWLDLFQSACYVPGGRTRIIDNKTLKEERGQFIASLRFLQTRWGWKSKTKVETFLKLLEKRSLIKATTIQKISHITICKYDSKVEPKATEKPSEGQPIGHQKDKVNKGNKDSSSKGSGHLFSESPYANDMQLFISKFDPKEYLLINLEHYYHLMKIKSESNGYRYNCWIAGCKKWILDDQAKGVAVLKSEIKPYSVQSNEELEDLFGVRERPKNEAA